MLKISPSPLICLYAISISLVGCQLVKPAPGVASAASTSTILPANQREYRIRQRISLDNRGLGQPDKQNLWVALIRDVPPYQKLLSRKVSTPDYKLFQDELGNQFAEFDFSDHPPGSVINLEIEYRLIVNELVYDLTSCAGELPEIFTEPELHIESANPQIIALADRLSRGKSTVCRKIRAFYDYIGDELVYTYNGNDWGAQAALGPMGADCTEYTSLLVALSRAEGIPARYYEGLRYLGTEPKAGDRVEHAWPEVFMPGSGWVALDPTLGRSTLDRENYFAHYTPDHIIVTNGRHPSTLRSSSYWTHLYWPGDSTQIVVNGEWQIKLITE